MTDVILSPRSFPYASCFNGKSSSYSKAQFKCYHSEKWSNISLFFHCTLFITLWSSVHYMWFSLSPLDYELLSIKTIDNFVAC